MTNKRYIEQIDEFIYEKNGTSMPFSLGTLVFVMFSVLLIILATFTEFQLFELTVSYNPEDSLSFAFEKFSYIIQIPTVVLISSILGMRFSIVTIVLYILMGLFLWPVFAFGGGIAYVKTSFFGYVLGYIPCVYLVSFFLKKFKNYKGVILAGVLSPISVYLTGFLYSLILLIFKQVEFSFISSELISALIGKMPYDILFSLISILIAKPLRYFIWLMAGNTKKPKKKTSSQ